MLVSWTVATTKGSKGDSGDCPLLGKSPHVDMGSPMGMSIVSGVLLKSFGKLDILWYEDSEIELAEYFPA